jgi:hypothetical protein
MKRSSPVAFEAILDRLCRLGVLLETDKAFPSLTGLMVNQPIKGSWWAHPMANEIYMMSQRLIHHPDAIFLKLLLGKTTYVHRRLWPELIAVGTAREPWQFEGLPASAKSMLEKVEDGGSLRMDELKGARTAKEKGADARTLELRMLVYGDDVHTDSGAHVKRIETWDHWARRSGFQSSVLPTPERAKEEFSGIVDALNAEFGAQATLPWQHKKVSNHPRARA